MNKKKLFQGDLRNPDFRRRVLSYFKNARPKMAQLSEDLPLFYCKAEGEVIYLGLLAFESLGRYLKSQGVDLKDREIIEGDLN